MAFILPPGPTPMASPALHPIVLTLALAVAVAGCGGGSGGDPPPAGQPGDLSGEPPPSEPPPSEPPPSEPPPSEPPPSEPPPSEPPPSEPPPSEPPPSEPPVEPAVSLLASPASVPAGGVVQLTWSSSNASSCTASGGWSGMRALTGTESSAALAADTTFVLSCSGEGGTASESASVAVLSAGSEVYPLALAPGGRHLVDAQGRPFLMHGDTAWSLMVQLTRDEVEAYLEDRRQKGFNAVLVNLIEHHRGELAPANIYGDPPFTTADDYATPNEAYFAHADWVIATAAAKDMLVVLVPSYMGFDAGDWYLAMSANGPEKLHAYGQYLATRFAEHDNILWVQGGDYDPPSRGILRSIPEGTRSVNQTWLHGFHGKRHTNGLEFVDPVQDPWLEVNTVYTDENTVVDGSLQEYARSTMPFFLIEARYEGEFGAGAYVARRQAWQAYLSGAFGHLFGNHPIWPFATDWEAALQSEGSRHMTHVQALLRSLEWWRLVPDTDGTVLTAGAGSGGTRAVAARAHDGRRIVAYVPTLRTVGIDLAQVAGTVVQARWYDPADGSTTDVEGSPFAAAGTRNFERGSLNAAGDEDWVLVLESG